jgi:hypothetical protein
MMSAQRETWMRRGTVVLAIFLLIALGVIGASTFLQNQPPITITIAVDPLIRDWAGASATAFNASGARTPAGRAITVTLSEVRDTQVWLNRPWTAQNHPDGWLATSSASVRYAGAAGYALDTVRESVAQTTLVWMGFQDRVEALSGSSAIATRFNSQPAPLDWPILSAAAEIENWGVIETGTANARFVQVAMPSAANTTVGLSALLSAAGSFHRTVTLDNALLSAGAFRDWLTPLIVVPNYTDIGDNAGNFVARRGRGADFALATESQWILNYAAIARTAPVQFAYPEYNVRFDFPLAAWDGPGATDETQSAVRAFGDYLTRLDVQGTLTPYGLRGANGVITGVSISAAGGAGLMDVPPGEPVEWPADLSSMQSLIRWFDSAAR